MDAIESYIYGLLLADGSLYFSHAKDRSVDNRGKVSLEVGEQDKDIVIKLFNIIPNSHIRERTRNTNFKMNYTTCTFVNSHKEFRDWLVDCGFPTQDKTFSAAPPVKEYSEFDFWRGFIDGDGSLGFNKREVPFISVVTTSEPLKKAYLDFLYKYYKITKIVNRNKRDKAYNILVQVEDAVTMANDLWQPGCLCLDRKASKAEQIKQWVRPEGMRKRFHKQTWTKEQDNYIQTHSLEDSMTTLNRTKQSIRTRLYRLSKQA